MIRPVVEVLGVGDAGRCRDERGAATVLVMAAVGVLLVLTAAGLHLGAAASAAHRARSAADLSALAGAAALQERQPNPCDRASELASRNGARLLGCGRGPAESVMVRVATDVAVGWPGVPDSAVASARAGPADVAGSKP